MIKIAVRSYGRHNQIWKKTLSTLSAQKDLDLGRQLVLAVTKEDYPLYKAELPEVPILDMIIVPKGGHNATNGLVDYFPDGEPVIFMDDDISAVKCYRDIMDKDSRFDVTNLGELFEYAFRQFSEPFGFDFTPNLMFKQGKPFAEFKMRKIGGAWWGAHIDKTLLKTEQSHEDDNIRTARALHRYGGVGSINWLVAATAVGTNKGGMQSSGDRGTDERAAATKAACLTALEQAHVATYYQHDPTFIDSMDFYSLRLRGIKELRKQFPMNKELKWSTYLQENPDKPTSSLEDFF